MRVYLLILLMCLSIFAEANTFYISPFGSDATGTGAITNPWKTLYKACQSVTVSGDIIHVNTGSYIETQTSQLAKGVSIEGEGIASEISSTLSATYTPILAVSSPEGTNGNQHISNLKFNGSNLTTFWAVAVQGRSNVSIYNCSFVDFKENAVMWSARADLAPYPPTIYATGNTFHDNTVLNCAFADNAYGRGAFIFGGQDGMLIYGNTMIETGRPTGTQGWPIKNCNEGHTKNCKIYNNTLKRGPFPYASNGDNNYWDFAIELFNVSGLEIYNNIIEGSIDCNHQNRGSSAYSVYIHDNTIGFNTTSANWEDGIILEYETNDAIIEKNTFKNVAFPIFFSLRTGNTLNNVRVNNNLAYNIGMTNNSKQGSAVRIASNDNIYSSNDFQVLNNTFIGLTGTNMPYWGINVPSGTGSSNIKVANNIVMNFDAGAIAANNAGVINTLAIQNNNLFQNANGNAPFFSGGTPVGYTNSGNLSVNPLFVAPALLNYTLQLTSPAVDAGTYVGLTYNGSAPDIGYAELGIVSNIAPTANAGADQTITLPTNTTTLTGSGNDPDGTITAYTWTKISGPTAGAITTAAAATTSITALVQGVYKFELKVTDNNGAVGRDTVQVTVNPDPNVAPTANAGADQIITLPTNVVTLNGSGNDPDGTIAAYAWTKISGPTAGTITNAANATTTVTALVQGVYKFELKVTDNSGAAGRDTVQITVNAAPNVAPTANAGADQTITLPINTVTLAGSGNDPDGTISAYAWTKISGPTAGTITSAANATTTVTALVQGVYKFELKVTDNSGAIGRDTVQVTVNPDPNVAPTANAGADQVLTLPTNSTTLNGSGNDPDGTIATYAWTKISGPTAGTITSAATATTTVTALVQGIYKFELKVTDNSGAVGRDTVQITVNAAANVLPTANAGADQTITLPINTVSLAGSGSDPDGTITAFAWTKISGPAAGFITNASNAITTVTALVQGVYQFELKVTDNSGATATDIVQITVNPAANVLPTANAGADQTITLPINTVSLAGSGSDLDGTITAFAWTKISGPAAGVITNASNAITTVTALVQGVYQFELKVTDNSGATATDIVQITVNAAANVLPTANAGADQIITLPINTVTLAGSGNDPDGTITVFAWTKISGPTAGAITNASNAITTVTALVQGIYQFELKVTDNSGATATDIVQITVNAAANVLPTANAGADQTITLPTNTVTLAGSGNDPDGTITAYAWTKISGPAAGTITNAASATTTITALVQGVYQFELKVTDNSGATATDIVQITVNAAANVLPTANAGADQTITLPINTVSLAGSGNDPDGTITAYAWTKISGPAAGAITNSSNAITTATALVQGVYQFELKVTDNSGATATDIVQITVNAAANVLPTANAGADQTITLPINTVTLAGSGNDPDGTIVSFAWTKISGPTAGAITNASNAITTVTALVQGIYQFELKVTDNSGATATDIVQITVNAAPIANAGIDQYITLPTNSIILSGSGYDADGSITSFTWTRIAGPVAGIIANASSAVTTVTGLLQGVYKYELKVTDNNGAVDTDTMQVVVFALNVAPTANAGLDQSITLPTNTVILSGSGDDIDGTITTYKWTKIAGPSGETILSSGAAVTTVTGLSAGVYLFELRVTDNSGAIGKDTARVTVNAANIPPVANAGPDQLTVLPNRTVTLTGSGTDVDGTVTGYTWKQISGPADKLTSLHTPVTVLDNLIVGTYTLELTVTDNRGATGKDTVNVVVEPEGAAPKNGFKIYPNPIVSSTTIDINRNDASATLLLVITDMNGKNVYQKQLAAGTYNTKQLINFSNLASGVYFVTVYFSSGEKQTVKAIKP